MRRFFILAVLSLFVLGTAYFTPFDGKPEAEPQPPASPCFPEEPEVPVTEIIPEEPEVPTEEISPEESKYANYIRALTDNLNVRSGAGTNHPSLGKLDEGDMLVDLGEENGWNKTVFRGQTAYVSSQYVEKYRILRADDRTERIIDEGCKLLGTPYAYGATRLHDGQGHMLKGFTPEKFDCSSLMQYIFYRGAGELLQVTTRTQVGQGTAVPEEEISRGDLLFFTNSSRKNKVGTERIGHVALYLGDGYILHTASDHAVIEKITSTRKAYFICARRI